MKREINLRTKNFKLPQQLYLTRLICCLIGILLLGVLVAAVIYLNVYRNQLEDRVGMLKGINEGLTVSAGPLEEMDINTELIRERIAFENSLRNRQVFWTDYINEIQSTAGKIVEVTLISGSIDGSIMIDGMAPTLEKVVVYTQLLEQSGYLDQVVFEHMKYYIKRGNDRGNIPSYDSEDSFYRFTIYGNRSGSK